MSTPSSSSAGLASETPATTSSTGIIICETDSPTTFSSSTPTTSTCFSFGVSSNSESTYPSLGAPMSANQQRNETGFSVYSTTATSKIEGSSVFTTATSTTEGSSIFTTATSTTEGSSIFTTATSTTEGSSIFTSATSADVAPVSADTVPVSADTASVSTNTASVLADTASVLADTVPVSADRSPVTANTASILADTASVSTNTASVLADTASVLADTVTVSADRSPITADTASVLADTAAVSTNTTSVLADTASASADTVPVSADRSPVSANTASVLADTVSVSTDTASVSADFIFGVKTDTNASSEISFGNTRSSSSFGDFKITAATTIADACTTPCFGAISNTSAPTGFAFRKSTTETSLSPFRGDVTTTTAQSAPISFSTRPTTQPAFRLQTRRFRKGTRRFGTDSTSTAALSVTTALGMSSTSTATHAFPTGFQFGTPTTGVLSKPSGFQLGTSAIALQPKPSGFKFNTPTTRVPSKLSGFQFRTPETALLPQPSRFKFSTPTTSISSKPSGFQFGTPAAALLSKPSGFQFSTPISAVPSKPFGFQSGTFTTAVTSTVTSTLPFTGFSVIPKAPATTCENGFTTSAPSGTTIKFDPPTGTDTMKVVGVDRPCNVRYQCITIMKEYENKAFEELRVEDYAANRGGAGRIAVESTSQQTWAATASSSGFFLENTKPLSVTTGTTNYSMAFPDWFWTYGGDLVRRKFISPVKMNVKWRIFPYLDLKRKEESESIMKLKSDNFSYAGATWNFFASIDPIKTHSQFGINVRTQSFSDEVFYCNCDIFLVIGRDPQECIKNMKCNFILPSAGSHWTVTDILTSDEIQKFLEYAEIDCIIRIKNIKAASSQTENSHTSRSSSVETQTQLPENKDEEILKSNPIYKVCQDLKQLLLSEEDSDVTIQVGDQQFKAHQSILKARSSVFAAMFHHDMKEKATGMVNAEDCEPSSFPVLLEFLYCGSTEKLSVENVFSLYTSADKYDIQDLKLKCLEFIKNSLAVETFCETVKLGLQHLETNLLKLTVDFFAGNFKKIIVTPKWQAFILENPIQGNEILIKALASDVHDL